MPQQPSSLNTKIQPLRALIPLITAYRLWVAATLFFLLAAAAVTLFLPIAIRGIIDQGFITQTAHHIDHYFIILLISSLALAAASTGRFYCVSWLGERTIADLRQAVYKNVLTLDPTYFEVTKVGEVVSRLTTDTTLIERVIGTSISVLLRNTILFLGALTMLVITSWQLSLIVCGLIPLVLIPILIFGRKYRRLSRSSQDILANSNALASETLNAITISQAFNHEDIDRTQYNLAVNDTFQASVIRIHARSWLTLLIISLIFSAIVCVLWIGAYLVVLTPARLTPGALGQFIIYAVLLASSTASLTEIWGEIQRAAGATERLIELLHAKNTIADDDNMCILKDTTVPLSIAFSHVMHTYPSRPNNLVINDFSLNISPGETVAIVGPSGAGKSTIFQILMKFYTPQQGEILVDDQNIQTLSTKTLRECISIVPQDTVIFSTNAMENIRYGKPHADDEEVIAAAKAAQADEFIQALPEQYQTYLGERGVRLSGGQRQRIAIARSMLRNAPILLLDEATSSLDNQHEELIQLALNHLMQDRTTLIIAHRLTTVLKANRIVVLDHGNIKAIGNHHTLLESSQLYRNLAQSQFASSSPTTAL